MAYPDYPAVGVPIFFLEREKSDFKRLVQDPPRDDYSTPVRAKRRRFDPGLLGGTPLEEAVGAWGSDSLSLSAYLEAAVRADERAQMALGAGRRDIYDRRLADGRRAVRRGYEVAQRVARSSVRAGGELSRVLTPKAQAALQREAATVEPDAFMGEVDLVRVLPEESLSTALRAGLVIRGLRPTATISAEMIESLPTPRAAVLETTTELSDQTLVAADALLEGYHPAKAHPRVREEDGSM